MPKFKSPDLKDMTQVTHNNRMQPDFGELALASAADARRYDANQKLKVPRYHGTESV